MGDFTEDALAADEQERLDAAAQEPEDAEVLEAEQDPADRWRSFLLRKTISDRVAAQVKAEREALLQELLELRKSLGVKQLQVNLPDETPVATLTISQPSTQLQAAEDELVAYLEREGREDLLDTVVIPAQAERTERRAKPHALEALTQDVAWIDGHPVTEDGEMLEWITQHTPPVKSFTVKYAKPKGQMSGDDRIVQEWLQGNLGQVDAGPDLPQLGQ